MASVKTSVGRDLHSGSFVTGRSVATLDRGMVLIKVGKATKLAVRPEDKTTVLLQKAARALNKPGIETSVIFRGPNPQKIFSYSVDPRDLTRVVQKASDGTREFGRLVDGKFRAIKS